MRHRPALAQDLQRTFSQMSRMNEAAMVRLNEWTNGLWFRLGLYTLLTAVFTMILVNYSLQHGRLAVGPTDDDCVYLVDALQRLDILHHTPKQFFRNLIQFPPHSPFSTGLGVLAFLVFGLHQWAPYAANGLMVLTLLLIVDYLTMRTTREARIAAILFALSFPFTANLITEFRPDCAVGVITGFGLVLLMMSSPLDVSRQRAMFVGLLAALALLIKPSFAPFTIFTFGVAWLVSAFFIHVPETRSAFTAGRFLRQLGWYALPSLLLALPYYVLHSEILHYIHNQAFGKYKSQWALKEAPRHVLRYYWDGAGGQMMLGKDRYVVLLLGLAAILLLPAQARRNWRFIVGYVGVIVIAYAIPTVTRMANPFFGTDHNVLILLGAVLMLSALLSGLNQAATGKPLMRGAAWLAVGLGLVAFKWPPAHYEKGSDWARTVNRLGQQLYLTIRDYPGSENGRVFFTAPGPVDDMLFRYHALMDNLKFECPNRHLSGDAELFRREIELADFVVASDPGSGVVYENMIAPNIQADALQLAQENSRLTELARFPGQNGKFFHVFVRRNLSTDTTPRKPVPFEDPWSPLYARD